MTSAPNFDAITPPPEWVVNNFAELGVKVGDRFFFLYKGRSLEYKAEDAADMHWRPVGKREFGECCHPLNDKDPTKYGTVDLGDSDEWRPLPLPKVPTLEEQALVELNAWIDDKLGNFGGETMLCEGLRVDLIRRALEGGEGEG